MEETNTIAVIGISAKLPQSPTLSEFWDHLINSRDLIQKFDNPSLPKDSHYIQAKGVLEDIDKFDAPLFGISNREAECMDPQQRLLLECCWEALEHAGYDPMQTKLLIGVYVSSSLSTYFIRNLLPQLLKTQAGSQDESLMVMGSDKDFLATKISYKLNLKGPSKSIQTACSSSLVAVHDASQSLLNYECDIALAGGVSVTCPKYHGYFYSEGSINSPTGHCKPFDSNADGTVIGNGAGVLILKRLEDALKDNDTIYGTLLSSCVNNDGSDKVGYTAPSIKGQAYAIESALMNSNIEPENLSFLEAHGTGTKLGDPIEIAALKKVYEKYTQRKEFCALGSVKGNIGHLDAASGIIGLIKSLLILKYKKVPPLCHFEKPSSQLDLENSPFFVNKEPLSLDDRPSPLRGAVSSFGIGGTNAHIVLEEPPSTSKKTFNSSHSFLVPISAHTPESFSNLLSAYTPFLEETSCTLPDLSYTLQVGRKGLKYRKCFVASSLSDLKKRMFTQATPMASISAPQKILIKFETLKDLNRTNLEKLKDASPLFKSSFEGFISKQFEVNDFSPSVLGLLFQMALGVTFKQLFPMPIIIDGEGLGKVSAAYLNNHLDLAMIQDHLTSLNHVNLDTGQLEASFEVLLSNKSLNNAQPYQSSKEDLILIIKHQPEDPIFKPMDFFFNEIAKLWEKGAEINWSIFNTGLNFSRIAAPTYPFEKHSYWINSPQDSFETFNKNSDESQKIEGSSLHEVLENLWKKTLKVSTLSPESDFFELGGDSLVGLEISNEIKNIFGVAFSIQHFFEYPKLNDQVVFLESFILEQLDEMSEEKAEEILQILGGAV